MAYNYTAKTTEIKTDINELKDTNKITDPGLRQLSQNDAKNKTLKTLNALKIISPVLQALIINSNKEDFTKNFKSIVSSVSLLSEEVCKKLEVDPENEKNFWIRNSFERVFSELMKEQWLSKQSVEIESIQLLMNDVIDHCDFVESEYISMGLTVDNDIKASLVRAMVVLISEIKSGFDLNRNISNDLEGIISFIFTEAKKQMLVVVDENADTKQKASLLKVLINEGVNLYASCWKSYAKFSKEYLDKSDNVTKEKLLKKYPEGFPLKNIEDEFKENFERLIIVTQKILPNKSGNLNNRIKNS